ncbi:MAG: hypothetical protein HY741_29930 [Chloroflexi bacterium]|nr:hypothetical protein [Chloroflexota bacterium]
MKEKIFALAMLVLMLGMGLLLENIWETQRMAASRTFNMALVGPTLLFLQITFAATFLVISWYILVKCPANFLIPASYLIVSGAIWAYFLGMFLPPFQLFRQAMPRALFAPLVGDLSFALESASFVFVIGLVGLMRHLASRARLAPQKSESSKKDSPRFA